MCNNNTNGRCVKRIADTATPNSVGFAYRSIAGDTSNRKNKQILGRGWEFVSFFSLQSGAFLVLLLRVSLCFAVLSQHRIRKAKSRSRGGNRTLFFCTASMISVRFSKPVSLHHVRLFDTPPPLFAFPHYVKQHGTRPENIN